MLSFFKAPPSFSLDIKDLKQNLSPDNNNSVRDVLSLANGWRFHAGDVSDDKGLKNKDAYSAVKAGNAQGAASAQYDDNEWEKICLPHDFVSYQTVNETASVSQGYRERGIAWYRNKLRFEESDKNSHIELQLDGIATNAIIWINGILVARNWSGYNSQYIDITPYLSFGEPLNLIAVRVDANAFEGWWYEGGGIYRDAWIVKRRRTHIKTDGVFAHPISQGNQWKIPIEVSILNNEKSSCLVNFVADVLTHDGNLVASGRYDVTMPVENTITYRFEATTSLKPRLWQIDDPYLYTVRTRFFIEGVLWDEVISQCGFRTQRFDPDRGFFLNGLPLKIKGVCLHQDHAGVGTAVPEGLINFRLQKLKELGCNAIRCAHNTESKTLMAACDRLGFLVMAENRIFSASSDEIELLRSQVRRDRNHASIILWSLFNEEPLEGTETGFRMASEMVRAVKDLDSSRSVTAALNDGLMTPINAAEALDVVGFNYQQDLYDKFHKAHPDIPIFSSEDTSAYMTRGVFVTSEAAHQKASYDDEKALWGDTQRASWELVDTRDFVAGSFVWSGFDYHGEPSPYVWPTNSSLFGLLDLCGFPKNAYWIRQALWIEDRPVLELAPHWNWEGSEGRLIRVMVSSNLDELELSLNGRVLDRSPAIKYTMNEWQVPYEKGHIMVKGYKNGTLVAVKKNETTGKAIALKLSPHRLTMLSDGRDAQPLTVEAIDAKGRFVPFADHLVHFTISGGEIIGLGNGDPNCIEPEKGIQRSLFNGLCQVIVQAHPKSAILRVQASSSGLKSDEVSIGLNPGPGLRYQVTC